MYGLLQAGILANKLLRKRQKPHGYYKVKHTPGLWKHVSRPTQFTLVVDDFGIKYVGKKNLDHLSNALQHNYTTKIDHGDMLYCGITLEWNYAERYVDISVPEYVNKKFIECNHPTPARPQHCPLAPAPRYYGKDNQKKNLQTKQSRLI